MSTRSGGKQRARSILSSGARIADAGNGAPGGGYDASSHDLSRSSKRRFSRITYRTDRLPRLTRPALGGGGAKYEFTREMTRHINKLVILATTLIMACSAPCKQDAGILLDETQVVQTQTAAPVASMWARLDATRQAYATVQSLATATVGPSPSPTVDYPVLLDEREFRDYTIRIYQNSGVGSFEIYRAGERVYAYAAPQAFWLESPHKEQVEVDRIAVGRDITGDGKANLVVEHWTGGAYCCYYFYVFQIDEQFKHIATLDGHRLSVPMNFVDLDEDGALEFVTRDWTFECWRTSCAGSPAPEVVLRYEEGTYQLACDLISKPIFSEDDLAALAQEIEKDPVWEENPPVVLWRYMLDFIYAGNAEQARQLIETAWPTDVPGKAGFWTEFLYLLSESPYWDELLECNPDLEAIGP